jgi:hypothetical protein
MARFDFAPWIGACLVTPAALEAICKLANEHDNPKRRKYVAGLGYLTCKRDKNDVSVHMPRQYKLPNRTGLKTFKTVLRGFKAD